MKRIYEVANSSEAYILRDMLTDLGVYVFIHGEYLQGGVGELPAFGLIGLSVHDEDVEKARGFLKEWEEATFEFGVFED